MQLSVSKAVRLLGSELASIEHTQSSKYDAPATESVLATVIRERGAQRMARSLGPASLSGDIVKARSGRVGGHPMLE